MSITFLRRIHAVLLSAVVALCVVVGALTVATFGGDIEGRLMPVVSNATVTRSVLVDGQSTRIWGSFEKHRDCAFVSLEWWVGTPQSGSRASVIFEEGSKDRDYGEQYFGPWLVRVPHDVLPFTTAIAVHRCHALWQTRTVIQTPE